MSDHSGHKPTPSCVHRDLGYCKVHDVAYCMQCQREWGTLATVTWNTYPQNHGGYWPLNQPLMAGGTTTNTGASTNHSAH